MTPPELITFDCANTLLRVRWSPGAFARDCAEAIGIEVGVADVEWYDRTLAVRWATYKQANLTRDSAVGDAFWRRLSQDWLSSMDVSNSRLDHLLEAAQERMYGPESTVFEPFDDVEPALDRLTALGCRLAVISNWDYSLHRVLRSTGLYDRFEVVIASLEEGVEKPDPRLFDLCLGRCGVAADRAAHVGDDPIDDYQGAQGAGMRSIWLDRNRESIMGNLIPSLTDLPGVLGW